VTDVHAAIVELLGTIMFLTLGLAGVQALNLSEKAHGVDPEADEVPSVEHIIFVSACMSFSLMGSAWLFYRATGGIFNPNVATALVLVGVIDPLRYVLYIFAQLLGAIISSALVLALTPGPLIVNTRLGKDVTIAQGLFTEILLTTALILTILMISAEKNRASPFAPIGVGLILFACHLWAVPITGAAMNSARAFGPAVLTNFKPYHWIYWVGPILGSLLATGLYSMLKHFKYWQLNPDADEESPGKSPHDPVDNA